MPLVRFAVRNEYGLGVPELYKDAVESEDPKAVLEGLTVAGLVGILRQLGDLAEYVSVFISPSLDCSVFVCKFGVFRFPFES